MSTFDSNRWYENSNMLSAPDQSSLGGDPAWPETIDSNGGGTAEMVAPNITAPSLQWQIWGINASYYALRSGVCSMSQWLRKVSAYSLDQLVLDSMLWKIGQWPDGSYYFTNAANGTGWLMLANTKFEMMAMKQVTTMPGKESRYKFYQLGLINNAIFSSGPGMPVQSAISSFKPSISSPSPTLSTPNIPDSTLPQNYPSSTSLVSNNGGISKGSSTAIKASLGAISLLVLIGLAFFLYPRYWNWLHIFGPLSRFPKPEESNELHGEHLTELKVPPAELKASPRHLSAELPGDEIRFISRVTS
ncbi:hypothetical protein BKA65DRAFT_554405 [Rhexocercosporidium sp. MPI-PUGE-AT-0058]|nr:hypothetical protein BKA65DRAFT_554405 [Rhexocercosporidium sp. MPI-PUGE-AT-0058]